MAVISSGNPWINWIICRIWEWDVLYWNPDFVSPSNHKYDIQDYEYVESLWKNRGRYGRRPS